MSKVADEALRRGYRLKFRPRLAQRRYLACAFGVARYVWNDALSARREAYQRDQRSLSLGELSKRLTALRAETPWLREIDRSVEEQSLRDLDRAFQNFFARRARFPRFKSRRGPQSIRLVFDARHSGKSQAWAEGKLVLPGLGACRLVECYPEWPAMPKLVTVSRDACGDYWVSFAVEVEPLPQAPDRILGVDVGITDLAVTSDGWKSGQLTVDDKKARRLKRYQRQVSRRKAGSQRRAVARRKLARLHRKIANERQNFLHQTSHHIASSARVVVLETLNVQGMLSNHHLAHSLSHASLGELHRQIDYKVKQRGGSVIYVDQWEPTSKRCSACGTLTSSLPLSVRHWTCQSCHREQDRDVNAARNLLALGAGSPEVTRGDWRVQEPMSRFRCARLSRESMQSPARGWTACG